MPLEAGGGAPLPAAAEHGPRTSGYHDDGADRHIFYGLYMDESLLAAPRHGAQRRKPGGRFALKIGQRATW